MYPEFLIVLYIDDDIVAQYLSFLLMFTGFAEAADMATATERAAIGAEEARMEGKGPGGRAAEAARNAATGRDQRVVLPDGVHHDGAHLVGHDGAHVGDRGLLDHHHHDNVGILGHTEEEMARLRIRTHISHEGEAYCPNPNIRDLVSMQLWFER